MAVIELAFMLPAIIEISTALRTPDIHLKPNNNLHAKHILYFWRGNAKRLGERGYRIVVHCAPSNIYIYIYIYVYIDICI
jgi:hypothetical protein